MSLKVTKDSVASVLKAMRDLAGQRVLVGVPADHADRKPDPEDPEPINNAAIGYIMENGSPARNIPARPHLQTGIADAKDEIVARYKSGAAAVLDGRVQDATKIHHAVGLIAENAVKKRITDGDFVPLSPRTIAARKRRGLTSEKPLTATGQYRNSITHVVRPK
jgi:hypothetical protein